MERALARVFREAGARVSVPLSHMNLAPPVADGRQIEVLAQGLPLRHGAQLAVDATLTSPVGRDGEARHDAATVPGDALQRATARKRTTTYPEFAHNRRCRLVVVAIETGGRWGSEAVDLVRALAHAKARGTPPWLRPTTVGAYIHRWAALLGIATQRAVAASFLDPPLPALDTVDGPPPSFHDLVAEIRYTDPPSPSRLPPTRGGSGLTRRNLCGL